MTSVRPLLLLALLLLAALALAPRTLSAQTLSVTDEGVENRFPDGMEFAVSVSSDPRPCWSTRRDSRNSPMAC